MKTKLKRKKGDSNQIDQSEHATHNRLVIPMLVLCAALAAIALGISLFMPGQLLSGGVVTWTVVGALMSGVVLIFRYSS